MPFPSSLIHIHTRGLDLSLKHIPARKLSLLPLMPSESNEAVSPKLKVVGGVATVTKCPKQGKACPGKEPRKYKLSFHPFLQSTCLRAAEAEKNNSSSLVVERTEPTQPVGGNSGEQMGVSSQAESRAGLGTRMCLLHGSMFADCGDRGREKQPQDRTAEKPPRAQPQGLARHSRGIAWSRCWFPGS